MRFERFKEVSSCGLVVFVFLTAPTPASAAPITGIARALDGDSIEIGNRQVRLFGIDPPKCDPQSGVWAE